MNIRFQLWQNFGQAILSRPENWVITYFPNTQPCKNKIVQNNDALMHLPGHLEHKIQWKEMADVDSFSTPDAKKKIKKLTNLCSAKW